MRLSKADILYADPRDWQGVFTEGERTSADVSSDPIFYLASVWAAREAVVKVLGGFQDGLAPTDIEISDAVSDQPYVSLTGGAATRASDCGIAQILLASASENDLVCSFALGLRSHRIS
jgi:holo-[acyl-carrier protein] synthase